MALSMDWGWMSFGSLHAGEFQRPAMRTPEGNLIRAILEDAVSEAFVLAGSGKTDGRQAYDLHVWATAKSFELGSLGWVCSIIEQESGVSLDPAAVAEAIVAILDGQGAPRSERRGLSRHCESGLTRAAMAA